ncbi:hypothetical protein [Massilia sp. YIM B04103]|uniref:hypothetical protein n=1 Tax=Massilia sp. YIM B04103 TaxID=2963106 RepID=UPI00210CA22E|nr:hypothetical protein [Massilia sp. YIM B04103]
MKQENTLRNFLSRAQAEAALAAAPEWVDPSDCPYDPNDQASVNAYWKNAKLSLPGEHLMQRLAQSHSAASVSKLILEDQTGLKHSINAGQEHEDLLAHLPHDESCIVLVFINSRDKAEALLAQAQKLLPSNGRLWAGFWNDANTSLDTLVTAGQKLGLRASTTLWIKGNWSYLRLDPAPLT